MFLRASIIVLSLVAMPVSAATTMDTFWTEPQAAPESFAQLSDGSFRGKTTENELFYQRPLVTDSSIRIHKFSIGTAYFYISDKGIIKAEDDLVAISMYLARV